ncbi:MULTISPECIES: Rv1733c family protein [unclassified Streptomyces]|uniref:Rv1733c family protein n=1 Tax=unclassified Streptomyces TaxID=2593676 RepID=UPI00403CDF7C
MDRNRHLKKRLWRLRNNPLRRHDDIVEAWIVLIMWAVVAIGGTLAGLVTYHAADEVFAAQRTERHTVQAVLLTDTPPASTTPGGGRDLIKARVSWTTADGTRRTASALVDTGQKAGSKVVVWVDSAGNFTTEPPSSKEATLESAVLGLTATLAFAGLAFGTGAVARYRLDQRRISSWDAEWKLVGPAWGRKTS